MAVSGAAVLICMIGLIWTFVHVFGGSTGEEVPAAGPAVPVVQNMASAADDGSIRILALGDSLTRGAGDSEGKGYVGYVVDELQEQLEEEVVLNNLGMDGLTSTELAAMLDQEAIRQEAEAADVMFLSIGANDLFQRGETLLNMEEEAIRPLEEQYTRQLDSILTELRELNASAPIYLIGLYNPFIEYSESDTTSKIVRDWNYETAETAAKYDHTIVVPTFDLFQIDVQQFLHTDMFHPNTEGYQMIADRAAGLIMAWGVAGNE